MAKMGLQDFHRLVATDEPADRLPRGPEDLPAEAGSVKTRKWIADWEGNGLGEQVAPVTDAKSEATTDLDGFKAAVSSSLNEFLVTFELGEVVRCIKELRAPQWHHHVVKRAVRRAMECNDKDRELIAVLIASLHARGVVTSEQVSEGFGCLAGELDDIMLDIPDGSPLLAHFLADAVLDGLLSEAHLAAWPAPLRERSSAGAVLAEAERRIRRRRLRGAALTTEELRAGLRAVVEEFFSSNDADEVRRRIAELGVPAESGHELVRVAVQMGLDRRDRERELVCQLLSNLLGAPFSGAQMAKGFETLIGRVDDLTIDNPNAPSLLAAFLVRAVADDVLPPSFVGVDPPCEMTSELRRELLTQARAQLAAAHFGERRRNVWGKTTDASVDELKRKIDETVREYFSSGGLDEAVRCVRELAAPAFMHEFVKRLVAMSLDAGAREQQLALQLTKRLVESEALSPEQLSLGCQRIVAAEPDLRLDNPHAPSVIADFLEACCAECGLPEPEGWQLTAQRIRSGS